MKPLVAWSALLVSLAATTAALLGPAWLALGLLIAASLIGPSRLVFWLIVTSLPFNTLFLGFLMDGAWALGPWSIGNASVTAAATATVRLAALVAIPGALIRRMPPPLMIDGLHLPRGPTALLGALWLATQDLIEDWHHLRTAQLAYGESGWRASAAAVPAMLARALRRGEMRHDALRLAGFDPHASVAPILAFSALAAASRMATVAIPNVAPTYLVVFLAGWYRGAWVGFASGAVAMLVTDLLISGPTPTGLVNVPAMALVGVLGAVARKPFGSGPVRAAGLAATGLFVTLAFSVISDSLDWLILPELRTTPGAWSLRVAFGLAFNLPAALANAALFALSVPIATRGLEALDRQNHTNR